MDKLITIPKAAEMLDCSPSKIYSLAKDGLLELKKIGYRATRVSELAVQQLMTNASTIAPKTAATPAHRRLRVPDTAKYLGVTVNTLYHMRSRGDGPPFIKIGNQIVYDTRALDSWLESKTYQSLTALNEAGG